MKNMKCIEDQEISWADLEFFRERETEGFPDNIRDIALDLDEQKRFFDAERLVITHQRIIDASRVILDLVSEEHFSLMQLLDGTIATKLGPTTNDVAQMVMEHLFMAAATSHIREQEAENPTYAQVHEFVLANIDRLQELANMVGPTFQLIDECLPMQPCHGGEHC